METKKFLKPASANGPLIAVIYGSIMYKFYSENKTLFDLTCVELLSYAMVRNNNG